MRIPFDSLCLSAVVAELQPFVGAKVQGVRQPDDLTLVLALYAGHEEWLLISADPELARAYLASRRPPKMPDPPVFALDVRRRIEGARVTRIAQRGLDRILEVGFEGPEGTYCLVAELMGKHSNLMLLADDGRVVAAAKWIGAAKSRRPVLPNQFYQPPPFEPKKPVTEAGPDDDLREFEGCSPFLAKLCEASGRDVVLTTWRERRFTPFFVEGSGAYPISVAALGLHEVARRSISQALEQHFDHLAGARHIQQARAGLTSQLRRVALAREVALASLNEAADAALRANDLQLQGQLILAYAASIPEGATSVDLWDFEGNPRSIKLNPELSPPQNANRLFDKAKRAKAAASGIHEQIGRLTSDLEDLEATLFEIEHASRLDELEELRARADKRRWLHHQPPPAQAKEDRPYQGHRIRETLAPGGWKVLYGENSAANDFLTLRVGKPNDWWLHVRGGVSAHVLILTQNQPEKVSREDLLFAARLAVRNSPSKHSGYVPVDYCLKKYVRRPKGAPSGTVTYSNEKTLHVD